MKKSEKDFQTIYHVTYLSIISILSVLLIVDSYMSAYHVMACPFIAVSLLGCWSIHFAGVLKVDTRIGIYTAFSLCCILFYGVRPEAINDVPIIICLLIIILSLYRSMQLVLLVAVSYPILIVWHILVTKELVAVTDHIIYARTLLDLVCIGCAVMISRFIIHDQKDNKNMIAMVEQQLSEVQQENEKFLTNVSHELRTPINAINGMTELLLQKEVLDIEVRQEIESIQQAGRRIYNQVRDILDYAELVTNRMIVNDIDYEITSVINDAINEANWLGLREKIEVAIDVQPDIPKTLHGDAGKIKKIIVELLDNAIKFTDAGGIYLYISKREETYGINLNIDVLDTGKGIRKEQIGRLYGGEDRQNIPDHRNIGGLGLGLTNVHGMVSVMGGFLKITSAENEGTKIHISIPQKVQNRQESMYIPQNSKFCIACYFNQEKYHREEVAEFYTDMIAHFVSDFRLNVTQTYSFKELCEAVEKYCPTHIFISDWEYSNETHYYNELAKRMQIIIIAGDGFQDPKLDNVYLIRKPVYILAVVNLLCSTIPGQQKKIQIEEKLSFDGVSALVVDDEKMNLRVAQGVLKSYHIEAEIVSSGKEAIEKCMLNDYQIIFMDYMMPEMDGIETMHRIRELRNGYYRNTPVVSLTANAVSGAREMFIQEGFDEFISKPIEMNVMSRVLKKLLQGVR